MSVRNVSGKITCFFFYAASRRCRGMYFITSPGLLQGLVSAKGSFHKIFWLVLVAFLTELCNS